MIATSETAGAVEQIGAPIEVESLAAAVASDGGITVSIGVYAAGDSSCCPSLLELRTFVLDAGE